MVSCEMCGKSTELLEAEIEGVILKVCSGCSKYGIVRKMTNSNSYFRRNLLNRKEQEFKIVNNCAQLIRTAREKSGLSQEDFAKFLNEKESIVAKWESGAFKPFVDVARRLEKKLGIVLIVKEESGDEVKVEQKGKADELTLGDFVKVRKR